MVRTRSGKESHPDDSRIPPMPSDEDHPLNEILNPQPRLAMKKQRSEKAKARFIVDNDDLTGAVQRMHLDSTKPSSSKTLSSKEAASSSKPSEEAGQEGPAELKGDDTAATPLENIPSMWDDAGYLAPDFDPSTMKIALLRNVLCRHNIRYSSADTKKTLVHIFNEEITPRAAATLTAMGKVAPSNEGIVDVHQGK
ncbi:Inner nuclear membrane protein SRC1 [Colletotrichum sp. SAR 10_99]|nr:Inner nuclear membrane protein SRC1 [Colletotrichum sp. SAR 10_99]